MAERINMVEQRFDTEHGPSIFIVLSIYLNCIIFIEIVVIFDAKLVLFMLVQQ